MNVSFFRKILVGYLLLLIPVAWLAMKFDPYVIDGDGVSYMDIADLLHAHRWTDAVNAYWHPLYPACLWLAQVLFHTTHWNELHAYYVMNFLLYLLQVIAGVFFARGLTRLRTAVAPAGRPMLSTAALSLIVTSMLVIAARREMPIGKIGTDGLLQALILLALAMMMEALAAVAMPSVVVSASLMGLFFGLGYLTKSFAFILTLICLAVMVAFAWLVQRRTLVRAIGSVLPAAAVFTLIAGPYIAALSHQKHRLTFGDSGSLNYAWYVSGTERVHLEPWETSRFGSAEVHLLHPEKQLMASPGVYSYKAHSLGTYPTWFDTTYFVDRITPRFSLKLLVKRDTRNVVLILRYVLDHPEAPLLLAVLLCVGGSLRGRHRYAWPMVVIGLLMWIIYAMVNVEERYVTVAYIVVLLPIFASLQTISTDAAPNTNLRYTASVAVVMLALLSIGELLRLDLERRRNESAVGLVPIWHDPQIYGAAEGLARMGIKPGDEIACIGTTACVYDPYWARLAGVRILTEVNEPVAYKLVDQMDAIPNRQQVYDTLKAEGARVLVGNFDPGEMNSQHPSAAGWLRLGNTNFYALPLTLRVSTGQ